MAYQLKIEDIEEVEGAPQDGGYQLSMDDITEVDSAPAQVPFNRQDPLSQLKGLYSGAKKHLYPPAKALGLAGAQTTTDMMASIQNTPIDIASRLTGVPPEVLKKMTGGNAGVENYDFSKFREKDGGIPEEAAWLVGRVGGFFGAPAKTMMKGASELVGQYAPGIIPKVAQGMATGYLTGESPDTSRDTAKALGGIAGGAMGAAQKYFPGSATKLADKLTGRLEEVEEHASDLYGDVFKEKVGGKVVGDMTITPVKKDSYQSLRKFFNRKEKETFDKFIKEPTLNNAQKLQTDAGSFKSSIGKGKSTSTHDRQLRKEADHLQKTLRKKIKGKLYREKGKGGAKEYDEAIDYYRDEVMPIKGSKPLKNYKSLLSKGSLNNKLKKEQADKMLKAVRKDPELMNKVMEDFPQLFYYNNMTKMLNQGSKYATPTALGLHSFKKNTFMDGGE